MRPELIGTSAVLAAAVALVVLWQKRRRHAAADRPCSAAAQEACAVAPEEVDRAPASPEHHRAAKAKPASNFTFKLMPKAVNATLFSKDQPDIVDCLLYTSPSPRDS